jgi:hypothetical protein
MVTSFWGSTCTIDIIGSPPPVMFEGQYPIIFEDTLTNLQTKLAFIRKQPSRKFIKEVYQTLKLTVYQT